MVRFQTGGLLAVWLVSTSMLFADPPRPIMAKPGSFKPITEPPCSYCSTQHRKNFVKPDDRVLAWIRANHL